MNSGVNKMVMVDGKNRNAASVCRTLQAERNTAIAYGHWQTIELNKLRIEIQNAANVIISLQASLKTVMKAKQ
jgi:hypothetical protein